MNFKIRFSTDAKTQFLELENDKSKKNTFKQVIKVLGFMETNIRHPSLNTHKYDDMDTPHGVEVFESYVQNNTPGAYRIFWMYGPGKGVITILNISTHP